MPIAKSLGSAYRTFFLEPIESKEQMQAFYVNRESPIEEIKETIISSDKSKKLLLIGERGSGITTELNRLSMKLNEEGKIFTFTYNLGELLDLGAFDLSTFFTGLAIGIYELSENGVEVEPKVKEGFEAFLIDLVGLTPADDDMIKRSFKLPLSGRLRFEMNYRSRSKKSKTSDSLSEDESAQKIADLVAEIDRFIDAVEKGLNCRFILILDDMDFILKEEDALDLFLRQSDLILKPSCSIIYAASTLLTSKRGFEMLKGRLDGVYTLLFPEDKKAFFKEVIYRRMDRKLIDYDAIEVLVDIAADLPLLISTMRGVLKEAYHLHADRITLDLVRSYLNKLREGKKGAESPLYRYTVEEDRKLFYYEDMDTYRETYL
ncbi:MAG: hypothetical protein OCU18_05090 [Candidatus Syntrophoarchaeum sp.]|nr:hypothetical protein [Candidatus Syntrophoarchaeum sp.]